jgi:hypothetical protein
LIFNTNDFNADSKALYKIKKDYWNEISTVQYPQLLYSVVVLQVSSLTNKNGSQVTTYTLDGASIESYNVRIIAKEWTYVSQGFTIKNFNKDW